MNNDYYFAGFKRRAAKQNSILQEFKKLCEVFGVPYTYACMLALAGTRKHTRTVYPPRRPSR